MLYLVVEAGFPAEDARNHVVRSSASGEAMSPESAALVVATVFLGVIALGLLYFLRSAVMTLRRLRECIDNVERRVVPLLEDMHTLTVDAHYELEKIDETVSKSRNLAETVEAAAGVARVAAATPVVKAAALAAGVKGTIEALDSEQPRGKSRKGGRAGR